MDPALRDLVAEHLPDDGPIMVADEVDLPIAGERRTSIALGDVAETTCAAVVLVDDELSRAGEHAEQLVDALGQALEPGGVLITTLRNRVHAAAARQSLKGLRGYSSEEATALLSHRGFSIEVVCAPGAAAGLRGLDTFDPELDRRPSLLDAAPRLLLIARAPRSADERSRVFLDSRPRKIAAAATLCRDPSGRVLVVYDRFKRMWTIPGGVVDAEEDPAVAAQRESWEEAGIKVETGRLLGVFASRWPDRLVFVFAATPVEVIEDPEPPHPHEIGDVAWVTLDEAFERLGPPVAVKVRTCLDQPGFTWVQ